MPTLREMRQPFADIIAQLQLQVDLTADFETIASHLRITEKRRGCADTIGNAGPLQRRIHPQHLRPLDTGDEAERGGRDRKHHPKRDLNSKIKAAAARCSRR